VRGRAALERPPLALVSYPVPRLAREL